MALEGALGAAALDFGRKDGKDRWGEVVSRDPALLDPTFARAAQVVFTRMRERGFDPVLFEGYRSPERAARLAGVGTGIASSMHSYGLAVDIIDRKLAYNAPRAFWDAVGAEGEAAGLVWGGRWTNPDRPHLQAVTVAQQNTVRRGSADQIAQLVAGNLPQFA